MEIIGKLIKILPEQRGESQRGPWVRGGFVIETEGEFSRQVAFDTFGEDRLAMINAIPLNSPVVVNFNPESREFNEKWYTNLRCTRVQVYIPGQMPPVGYGYQQPMTAPMPPAYQPPMPAAPMGQPAQPAASFATAPTMPPSPAPASTQPGVQMPETGDDLPF